MKTVTLEVVASGTSKKLRERVIKGHILMRFGSEYKVFLEMIEITTSERMFCILSV
jgi:hypothetical protein